MQKEGARMDTDTLLDLVTELGFSLAMSGAETFRIEDSINRILNAYGVESEVFAITNSMIVSIRTPDGKSVTKMKRIGFHSNDLDSVERYNSLSRRICAETPEPSVAVQWLKETHASRKKHTLPIILLGSFLGSFGFAFFFGGTLMDALCGGLCGLLLGLTDLYLQKFKTNNFFRTISCAFIMTFAAYVTALLGIANNTDMVIIGPLMILVPGLIFTNAMRDIIYGDTNSGINRIVQVFLVAAAIALGTGVASRMSIHLWGVPDNQPALVHSYILQCIAAFVGCYGFTFLFNIHGFGGLLCAFGGCLTWGVYCVSSLLGFNHILCYFCAALMAAGYAETMARIRKYPAISYLVTSIFPLIPGAGIYYTTNYLVIGDLKSFASQGKYTIAIAGVIAVGILLVSTIVHFITEWKQHKQKKIGKD